MSCIPKKTYLYELLGQIVVSFRLLEQGIDGLILSALDSPMVQSLALLNGMSFEQKVSAMNNLIRSSHSLQELGVLDQTLHVLVERCLVCERERNDWICSYWVPEVESEDGLVMRLRGSADSNGLSLTAVDISELESFVVVLNATAAYLDGFHQKLSSNFKRVRSIKLVDAFLKRNALAVRN